MRFDIPLLFLFIGIGLVSRKVSWKGWFAVALLIAVWMGLNLWSGLYS